MSAFCRFRVLRASNSQQLGDFNVSARRSHANKHIVISLHGKDPNNKDEAYHGSFFPDRAKELMFRLRYELEFLNDLEILETEYHTWVADLEAFKLVKQTETQAVA